MRRVVALLLVVSSCLVFAGCSFIPEFKKPKTDKELIEERIETFVEAYNDGDVEKAMESMTPKIRNAFESIFGILNLFVQVDVSEIFKQMFSIGVAVTEGDYIDVEIVSVSIDDDTAVVETVFKMKNGMLGETQTEITYFIMAKKDDGWFIDNITDYGE